MKNEKYAPSDFRYLAKSLIKFFKMSQETALYYVSCWFRLHVQTLTPPNSTLSPVSISAELLLSGRPYHTEIQLYRSLESLRQTFVGVEVNRYDEPVIQQINKDNKKTRGKTRLIRMLKEGKELKVFQINTSQLHEFARLSKTYGILFTALRDKKNPDGLVDLMVKAEDASKVSRTLERLKIASYDVGEITATLDRDQARANPTKGRTTGSRSGSSLPGSDESVRTDDRPSVREQLKQIKARLKKDRPANSRPNMRKPAHSSKAKPGR